MAKQKGEELKLNPVLKREVRQIRVDFSIPENGFQNSVQSMTWQRTIKRQRSTEWSGRIKDLRVALNKREGWHKSLELYIMVNELVGPLKTVQMVYRHDLMRQSVEKSFKVLDEPIRLEDVRDEYETDLMLEEGKSGKGSRLYDLHIWKMVAELSRKRYDLSDERIAEIINSYFNRRYNFNDISSIRSKYKKKFGTPEK